MPNALTVTVREVGPRDGLQMAMSVMPTAAKQRWIAAMVAAGVAEMEVASFVPPAAMPQMADAATLFPAIRAAHPALRTVALAPNLRGAQNAAAAGAQAIIIPVSASEAHSRANVRRSQAEQVAEVARVATWAKSLGEAAPRIEAGISTAFGCSLQGVVPERDVLALASALIEAGADTVALADTLGYATPSQVRRLVRALRAQIGAERCGNLHLHDTLGCALANVYAALEEGVRGFDAALGGLGGCPFAPGSVGNVATEDLVYLLEQEGFATGIDLAALIEARAVLREGLPDEPLHGRVAAARVPPTYRAVAPVPGHAPAPTPATPAGKGPLAGIRVLEFTHMVMGPSAGMILADLGADVVKVEPAEGDATRKLTGLGVGFFPTFNRNKRSLCVDLKRPVGIALVKTLAAQADVVVENFRPGALDKLGLGAEALCALNPRLVYAACKGFLPGPYEQRTALDEVVQMMGGLAYMTGPPGRPLRTGASVNDIMGGMFAAIAVMAALRQREATGRGGLVQSGLFETNMVLSAQNMAAAALYGKEMPRFGDPSMPKPWPIFDLFDSNQPDAQVFVGVVSVKQWRQFAEAFGLQALLADPELQTLAQLATARPRLVPAVAEVLRRYSQAELIAKLERLGLPFAMVAKPSELFQDPHLLASGGLLPVALDTAEGAPGGHPAWQVPGLPGLPIALPDGRPGLTRQPPRPGEHSAELAREAGLSEAEIAALLADGTLGAPQDASAAAA